MADKTKKTRRAEPLLGAHMSISGGLAEAIRRGESIGCRAIQIFLKNSNQWHAKPVGEKEARDFRDALAASAIECVFGHDSYLINLASPKDDLYEKSIAAMADEVERAALLGVPFIVIHPGSHVGEGEEWGLQRVADGLNEVFRRTAGSDVVIALETTAGQGTNLGARFEHLAILREAIGDKKRVAACLDTCHLFSAGYDLRSPGDYAATMRAFDEIVGLKHLVAIHLNDDKKGLGSRVDRHEQIGQGELGLEPFRHIMNDPRLDDVPKVLETPKGPDMLEDVENMRILRSLMA